MSNAVVWSLDSMLIHRNVVAFFANWSMKPLIWYVSDEKSSPHITNKQTNKQKPNLQIPTGFQPKFIKPNPGAPTVSSIPPVARPRSKCERSGLWELQSTWRCAPVPAPDWSWKCKRVFFSGVFGCFLVVFSDLNFSMMNWYEVINYDVSFRKLIINQHLSQMFFAIWLKNVWRSTWIAPHKIWSSSAVLLHRKAPEFSMGNMMGETSLPHLKGGRHVPWWKNRLPNHSTNDGRVIKRGKPSNKTVGWCFFAWCFFCGSFFSTYFCQSLSSFPTKISILFDFCTDQSGGIHFGQQLHAIGDHRGRLLALRRVRRRGDGGDVGAAALHGRLVVRRRGKCSVERMVSRVG